MKIRTKSAIGRQSRAHGHQHERNVAEVLRAIWPAAVRNLSQTRSAGREGSDVLNVPFWVEAKAGRAVDIKAAWRQAKADRDGFYRDLVGLTPAPILLVVKEHHRKPFVVCTFKAVCGWEVSQPDESWSVPLRLDFSAWMAVQLSRRVP